MQRSPASHEDVPTTVEQLLAAARSTAAAHPGATYAAMRDGAQLVDIRSDTSARPTGSFPARTSWPATSSSGASTRPARTATRSSPVAGLLVLICDEGFQSSLAAATVQRFGERSVTDVIGGFRAWRPPACPVQPDPSGRPA